MTGADCDDRGILGDRHLIGALVVVVVWLALLQVFHPGAISVSDEVGYTAQALRFADNGSLESGTYYFTGLLDQDPPLRYVHHPGYPMLLGAFFRVAAVDAIDIAAHETIPSFLNYLLLGPVALALFLALRRCCRSDSIAWLGLLLFVSFPLVNQYATLAMSEITVLAVTFAVLMMLFGTGDTPTPGTAMTVGVGVLLGAGILVRQSLVFLVPVVAVVLWTSVGRRQALILLGVVAALAPVYLVLVSGRVEYPGGTLRGILDAFGRSPGEGLRGVIANIDENMDLFFTSFEGVRYTLHKVLFWSLSGAMVAAVGLPQIRRIPLARAAVTAFLVNTMALFAMYEVRSWRGLRVSMNFIPLAIIVVAIAADGLTRRGRRVAVALLAVVTIVASATTVYSVGERTGHAGSRVAREAGGISVAGACFEEGDGPTTVLIDSSLGRIRLAHPEVTWVMVWGPVEDEGLGIVDSKVHFDCVVARRNWPVSFADIGMMEVAESGVLVVYRRDPAYG
jgi:hypothetical protein